MKIFGFEIARIKAGGAGPPVTYPVYGAGAGSSWWNIIREPFAGAWQKNIVPESRQNILAFSAVYACVSMIADDVSKLAIDLIEQDPKTSIWIKVQRNAPHYPVLIKPNGYQNRIQFLSQWITSKLLHGNTYVYMIRDKRGVVTSLHILDPRLVTPLVTQAGDVYYQLNQDYLAQVPTSGGDVFAASEIIHDRGVTLFHPLVGVSPIYACGASATQGIRIQNNSSLFFENMSRPSGTLTSPNFINDETADRLKKAMTDGFSGSNIGKLLVAGDGLKYEPMTIPAADAQLIEQLKWTVEDVARCFKVPLYKIASTDNPKFTNYSAINQDYYSQTLQNLIECIELCLDEGLGLPDVGGRVYGSQLDLDGLLRMDPLSRAELHKTAISAGYETLNEARADSNRQPLKAGGDSAYLQQQNYSVEALAKRDALDDPFASSKAPATAPALPAPATPPAGGKDFLEELEKAVREMTSELVDA